MIRTVRLFLLFEAACFVAAALIHSGILVQGYAHAKARVAETVIAVVLLVGLITSVISPGWARKAGLAAQGFALLGTLVGVFTIVVGVGPRTVPDILYHLAIIAVLAWGLVVARKAPVG